MVRSTFLNYIGAALCVAGFAGQSACLADEVTSTEVRESTPVADSSTASTTVSTPSGTSSNTYHAHSGPGGAKVSATHTNVHGNADGSVSATRTHESHAVNGAGAVHHQSASSTTVAPDGSTASVKHEATSTNP